MSWATRFATYPGAGGAGRRVKLAVPVLVPVTMVATFAVLRGVLRPRRAYDVGFAVYWLGWGVAVPVWLLGPRRAGQLLGGGRWPRPAEAAVALVPVVGAVATELLPRRRLVSPRVALVMVLTAALNAATEELLWRGLFLDEEGTVTGGVWPLLGFSLWHLAPQLVLPSRRGRAVFLAGSALVGASSTMLARRTGGLRAALLAHFLTDACGVGPARFRLGLPTGADAAASPTVV